MRLNDIKVGPRLALSFGLVLLILYLPIFYLIYFSFSSGSSMDHFRHFTWEHYQTLFADKRLLAILLETIMLALLSSLAATEIGRAHV